MRGQRGCGMLSGNRPFAGRVERDTRVIIGARTAARGPREAAIDDIDRQVHRSDPYATIRRTRCQRRQRAFPQRSHRRRRLR